MKIVVLFSLALLVAGCSSQPIALSDTVVVPQARIVSTPALAARGLQDGGKILVVRDPIRGGKGPMLMLSVDGVTVANMEPGERYEAFLKEGEHILSIIPVPNRLSQFTLVEVPVTVKVGHTYAFRAGFASTFFLHRTSLYGE